MSIRADLIDTAREEDISASLYCEWFDCVFALFGFVIAAEIQLNEPSAVARRDDLANFGAIEISSLARKRVAHIPHTAGS